MILYDVNETCALCDRKGQYAEVASAETVENAPDLDIRPPETERSTIVTWVQRCAGCGYCSDEIKSPNAVAEELVYDDEYRDQLNDPTYPKLANSFLCKAMIDEAAGNYADAAWAMVHAAWVCDDAKQVDQAILCRKQASKMVMVAEDEMQLLLGMGQSGASTAILVDLLRRSGELDQAKTVISDRRGDITEEVVLKILDFHLALIERGDVSGYTMADIAE